MSRMQSSPSDDINVHIADLLNGTPTYGGVEEIKARANLLQQCGTNSEIKIFWNYKDADGWHTVSKGQKVTRLYFTQFHTLICASRHCGVTLFWEAWFSPKEGEYLATEPMLSPPLR